MPLYIKVFSFYSFLLYPQDEERGVARLLDLFDGSGPAGLIPCLYGATQPGGWAASRRPINILNSFLIKSESSDAVKVDIHQIDISI